MAILLPTGKQAFFTSTGAPLVGGKVFTYAAGTNTLQATYADAAGAVPNTNPIILDARGEAAIFWNGSYKVVLQDALGNTIWTMDNISTFGGATSPSFASLPTLTIPTATSVMQTSGPDRGLVFEDPTLTDANVAAYPLAIKKTANGRYFRRDPRDLWFEQFGAVGDAVTNNNAAFDAALSYAAFCARIDSTQPSGAFQSGSPTIQLGIGAFAVSKSFDLHSTYRILGQAQGMELGGGATVIIQNSTNHVFIVNRADTTNFVASPATGGADGTEIAHIHFVNAAPNIGRGLAYASAVATHARVNFHDNIVEGFSGPGLQTRATVNAGGTDQGEASGSYICRNVFNGNFINLYNTGGDANVQEISNNTFGAADQWGVLSTQFLSCTFVNNHFKGNGTAYIWTYNGARYSVVPGQEAAASTTVPGTNSNVWSIVDNAAGTQVWVSGGTYAAGGSVCHNNRNARSVFLSNYFESGQGLPMIMYPAMSIGGQWAHAAGADGIFIGGEQGSMIVRSIQLQRAGLTSAAGVDPATGFQAHNGASSADFYFGPRGNGAWLSIGQGDAGTLFYMSGPGDATPGMVYTTKLVFPGPYANNAAAVAAGLGKNTAYVKGDGTLGAVI